MDRRRNALCVLCCCLGWLLACGVPSDPAVDAGRGEDAGGALELPAMPAEPRPPELGACPPAWSREDGACSPASPACAPLQLALPTGCAEHPSCDEGPWTVPEETRGRLIYVSPDGTGDGTRAEPFGRLADALTVAGAGDVVLLSKGTHPGGVVVPEGVEVRGACAAETRVVGAGRAAAPFVVGAPGVVLRDLTVDGFGAPGLVLGAQARVQASDLRIVETTAVGISAEGEAALTGERIRIGAVAFRGDFAAAINAIDQAEVRLTRSEVAEAGSAGVVVTGGARVELDQSWLHDTTGADGLRQVAGVIATRGGRFVARESLFTANASRAFAVNRESSARLEGCQLSGGRPYGPAREDFAAAVSPGGTLELLRSRVERFAGAAFIVAGELRLTDTRIADIAAHPVDGTAVVAAEGARVRVARVEVDGTTGLALSFSGPGTEIEAEDLRVERVSLAAGRAAVAWAQSDGARSNLERVLFSDAGVAQLFVDGATLSGRDVTVRDSRPLDGRIGYGAFVGSGAQVSLERVAVLRAIDSAIVVQGEGARLEGRDLRLEAVRERDCDTPCPDGNGGFGLGVYEGGEARISRFTIRDMPFCGVHVGPTGSLQLTDGWIDDASIGACLHATDFPLEAITDGVRFENTEITIDTVSLPIPEPPTLR